MIGLEYWVIELLHKPWGRVAVGLSMVAFGMLAVCFAYPQIGPMRQLKMHGIRTTADVTDARISSGLHGLEKSYGIRYRFRSQPDGPWYERSEKGPLARKELWAGLPKERWEQVTKTGTVEVEYLPSDPLVNEIAGEAGHELTGVYCIVGFGAVLGGSCLAVM